MMIEMKQWSSLLLLVGVFVVPTASALLDTMKVRGNRETKNERELEVWYFCKL